MVDHLPGNACDTCVDVEIPPDAYQSDFERCVSELFEKRFCCVECINRVVTHSSTKLFTVETTKTVFNVDGIEAINCVSVTRTSNSTIERGSLSIGGASAFWETRNHCRDLCDPFLPHLGWLEALAGEMTPGDVIHRLASVPTQNKGGDNVAKSQR